jgi:TetR/AcrR family transcriptional regulator, transcriptional repressor for nem operon
MYILIGMLPGTMDLLVRGNRPKRSGSAPRDPECTRVRLLQAAFREVYRSGFQSAGLNSILAAAGVTRGALYHHFGSKEALGYAIVDEIIAPDNRGQWLRPLENCVDPIDVLIGAVQELSVKPEAVRGGCPLLNLAQEMSPLDAGFRQRLATIFHNWLDGVAAALRDGQNHGTVRRDLEPAQAAGLLIATVEGYGSLAKNAQDARVMEEGIRNIVEWLRSLRPPGSRKRADRTVHGGPILSHTNRSVLTKTQPGNCKHRPPGAVTG